MFISGLLSRAKGLANLLLETISYKLDPINLAFPKESARLQPSAKLRIHE